MVECRLEEFSQGLYMSKPLRDAINDAVAQFLEHKLRTDEPVNVAAMANDMALSIVDMILEQSDQNQAPLIATAIRTLGDEYLVRRGFIETERRDH
jgi:DNA-binding protein Fis